MEGHSSRDRLVGLWSGGSGQKQARHVVTDFFGQKVLQWDFQSIIGVVRVGQKIV